MHTSLFVLLLIPAIVLTQPFLDDGSAYEVTSSQDPELSILTLDVAPDKPVCREGRRCSANCFCPGKCLVGRFSLRRTCFF